MIQKEERIGGGRDDVAYYPGETPEPLIPGCTFSRRARVYENHATHSIAGGVSIAAKLHGFRVLSTLKLFPANRKNSPSSLCTPPPFPVCHTVIVSTAFTVVTRRTIPCFMENLFYRPDAYPLWLQKKLDGNCARDLYQWLKNIFLKL